MFHVCTIGQKGEVTDIKFLCLNGTVFDQETRVCERIDEVDCSKSEDFFGLNLELYGNNANFGIQPENEFECEDCSTDQTGDDEYEESEETTTYTTSTTTTTTTTTTPKPTTTTTTTARPTNQYHTSSQDTIAALLALHNAFNQGLQGSKVKAPPPRVINNAFSPTKPTIKPYSTYPTQRSNVNLNFKSHYTPDSQSYGSLNLQQRERPYYFTPATEKSNYHHFHSGDTSFGHSFDVTRPYNFQYFHSRKIPEKASVSVVTSTSTSTSVKTSKPNATEFPTGYDDYQDDIQDSFFDDVPKLRQKRELHANHKYDEEVTTVRYKNHKYDDEPINGADNDREQFLQNLLGSIDLEDNIREKMTDFFKKEEEEMDNMKKTGSFTMNLGNKIGQIFLQELNMTDADERKTRSDKLLEWRKHFEDMKRDISLNYTFETNLNENDNNKLDRQKRDTRRVSRVTNVPPQTNERNPARRTNIDTEKFHVETRRGRPGRGHSELIPVSEAIEDDFTTIEYRRTSKRVRSQPRSTTSLRGFKYNYETTSALPESIRTQSRQLRRRPLPSKEARDFVHEDSDHLVTTIRYKTKDIQSKDTRFPQITPSLLKENKRLEHDDLESVTPSDELTNEELRPLHRQTSISSLDAEKNLNHDERFKTDSNNQRTREPVLSQARTPSYNPLFSREGRREFEPRETTPALPVRESNRRRKVRVKTRIESSTPTTSTTIIPPRVALTPDPEFDCEGKVKGGFYADIYNDCRAFFICSQGEINGPLLKSHFACGDKTKFNQRSRTCQAEDLVDCSISKRYFHLNNDFLVPDSEDELRGGFEPMKER